MRATPGRQRRASSQQDRLSGGARCRARQRGSTWVSRGLRGVGNPTPPQRLRTPSLLLGSRCKRQLAQGAQAKLQLALIRAGAVTPPALPAPSPPLDRPRGRGRGTDFTVGVLIGERGRTHSRWSPYPGLRQWVQAPDPKPQRVGSA